MVETLYEAEQRKLFRQDGKILSPSAGYRDNAYIHTQGGRFYAARPTWNVEAIAHALAQTARYRGNADEQYSVAEHSLLVAALMDNVTGGNPAEGLMHDASESVLPDVSSPFKQLFPDLRKVEKEFDRSLRKHYGLPLDKSNEAAKADWLALFIEASMILPERGEDFEDPYRLRPMAHKLREQGWRIQCLPWRNAKAYFIDEARSLGLK